VQPELEQIEAERLVGGVVDDAGAEHAHRVDAHGVPVRAPDGTEERKEGESREAATAHAAEATSGPWRSGTLSRSGAEGQLARVPDGLSGLTLPSAGASNPRRRSVSEMRWELELMSMYPVIHRTADCVFEKNEMGALRFEMNSVMVESALRVTAARKP